MLDVLYLSYILSATPKVQSLRLFHTCSPYPLQRFVGTPYYRVACIAAPVSGYDQPSHVAKLITWLVLDVSIVAYKCVLACCAQMMLPYLPYPLVVYNTPKSSL